MRKKAVRPSRIKPTQLCSQSITDTDKARAGAGQDKINMRTYDQVVTYWPDHAAVYNKIKVWYRNNAKFGKFIGKLNVGAIYANAHLRKIYLIHRQSGDITIFEKDAYLLRWFLTEKCVFNGGSRRVGVSVLINYKRYRTIRIDDRVIVAIEIRLKPICGSNDKNYFENRTILSLFCAIFS